MNEHTTHRYDDIIDLPRPASSHPPVSQSDRAAQFAPFAALTGYDAAVEETGRLTDARRFLDEDLVQYLNERLSLLQLHEKEHPEILVTYFVQDPFKDGGSYVTENVCLRHIDTVNRTLFTLDGKLIALDDIVVLESSCFSHGETV